MIVAGKKAKVIFPFDARRDKELTLKEGDTVSVERRTKWKGWMVGMVDNKRGEFPAHNVVLIDEKDAVPLEIQRKQPGLLQIPFSLVKVTLFKGISRYFSRENQRYSFSKRTTHLIEKEICKFPRKHLKS